LYVSSEADNKAGYVDSYLQVRRRIGENPESIRDPGVLWMEVGLSSKVNTWWRKVNQAFFDIQDEIKERLKAGMTAEPMLLAVLHIGSDCSTGFEHSQLGVFLVIPMSDGDFRLALLRRMHSAGWRDVMSLLPSIFQATQFVADWNRMGRSNHVDFEYLGSHCCRIGSKVSVSTTREDLLLPCSQIILH
jgi:hypothetical protein